jgi:hypothetical protein
MIPDLVTERSRSGLQNRLNGFDPHPGLLSKLWLKLLQKYMLLEGLVK